MEISPIKTESDYKAALREVSAYFDNEPEPNTPDGDRFEALLTLIEAYEREHNPVDPKGGLMLKCSICEVGELHQKTEMVEQEYRGHKRMLPLHFSVCDHCETETLTREQSIANKQAMLDFKAEVNAKPDSD